jgi:acetoin utilization deacetylase AcuC-like enzyme
MRSALFTHPDCTRHAMPHHPERPERLIAVMERLRQSGLAQDMLAVSASPASDADLAVHRPALLARISASEPSRQPVLIDLDTYMSPGSLRAARLAAGACVDATRLVLAGSVTNAFCAVRPPGHHAELAESMGFCLFNNIAAAASVALAHPDIGRVAILDFDVHHCNGTVDIFRKDPRVLVCSSFQKNWYPHRYLDFSNDHIVTTPLDPGTGSTDFRHRIEQDWLPALDRFKPDFIFVSAGFDAHHRDPLGELALIDDDYRWITGLIAAKAREYAKGRLVSTLEGGYDLEALASSACAHVAALVEAGSVDQGR